MFLWRLRDLRHRIAFLTDLETGETDIANTAMRLPGEHECARLRRQNSRLISTIEEELHRMHILIFGQVRCGCTLVCRACV